MPYKKIAFTAFCVFVLAGILFDTAFFLPNELAFKFAEAKGDYTKAKAAFPQWNLMAENNEGGKLYNEKKYTELQTKLAAAEQSSCGLQNEKIPSSCANIFYLQGLTEYRLGKDLESDKQKPYFERAISAFQKVMAMTPKDSQEYTWAKENIDFILRSFAEKQQQEAQKNGDKNGKDGQQQKKDGESSDAAKKDDNAKNSPAPQENGRQGKEQNNPGGEGNEKSNEKTEEKEQAPKNGDTSTDSRLPKQMQDQLDEVQKELQEGSKDQKGFNRSASAAENNSRNDQDPFGMMQNDPFFQDFFQNDPFFQNSVGQKNFKKNLEDPNQKDW